MKQMKDELKKLSEMNFQEKREYIWEYYKFHIIITGFLLFFVGSLINSWFINPPKKEYLYFAWMGSYVSETQQRALADALTAELADDPAREEVLISTFFSSDDVSYNAAVYNRLLVMISAGQLDAFIMEGSLLTDLINMGYLTTLDGLVDELVALKDAPLREKLTPMIISAAFRDDPESETENRMMAINLKDCPLLVSQDIYSEDLYLGVVVNTKKVDIIARALQFMYRE